MREYLRLLRFLKGHFGILGLATVFMLISTIFDGVQLSLIVPLTDKILTKNKIIIPGNLPDFARHLIDLINATDPMTLLWSMPIAVMVMLVFKGLFGFGYGYLMNDVSQRVMRDIRFRLYERIQTLSLDYFSKKRAGELIARITNDVQVVENAVSYGVTDLIRQTFTILMFIGIAFFIYFKVALMVFLVFPLVALPMQQIGRKLRKISKNSQEKMADINAHLLETISGVRVVKAFCMEQYEIKRFHGQNHDFYKLKMKAIRRTLLITPLTEILGGIFGVAIIWWLGRQVIQGEVSFGVFVLFFGSIMSIISPLKKLTNVHVITQQALAANDRIYEVLDAHPTVVEKPQAQQLPVMKEGITLDHISFSYDQESGEVLRNITLEINVGEIVAIVGPTGTGKSTVASLIPRFYDPQRGSVKVDGIDVRDVTFQSLRHQIGVVAQETILFNDTVRANIAYGRLDATEEEIKAAAFKAFAHAFIEKMPNGYATVVGDRGFRLSGGEKQRIAIARAILKNPPILILDEATSQLDSESEKFVQEALDELMKGRTVICIAHRLSTIKKADKIVVLDHGQIVGLGQHEDLLKTCNLYKRLYETQFQM